MALHDQSTADLHGDTPSAFSTKGFADRKELASFAFERTRMPMVVVDARAPDQPIVLANSAFLKLTGYTADEVIGRNCRFLQGQGTSPLAIAAIRSAIREEREVTVEILNYRKGGAPFWNQLHTSPLRADDGTVDYIFASQIDVTERRRIERLEASEHRLLKEVDHRAKNVMAIVDSIVRLSNAEDPKRYAAAIQMRVQALAQVHTMLAESGWSAVRLEEVVRQQVAPFAEKRLTVFGPPVMLPSPLVQPLGLVLHELAVNATRHGCLRAQEGTVAIQWEPLPDESGFELEWVEAGPPLESAERRPGFGSILVTAMIETQLKGRVHRTWTDNGLELRLSVPLSGSSM
ncbi:MULTISPECIES: HWE histidine kinase domain-containing protein [Rhizobium/Agrobacterium group]|uniref:blue-light-activated histidine kinase n=1 Tax=Rhizobium/Agrobacterium group TaxID=227290 RepID=UPI000713C18E|nr:PAS domain-containing protein [Rhizobium sp. Root483D2]KQY41459.1 PAS domain S-box protein [Rhizobium sp. Root483D2]